MILKSLIIGVFLGAALLTLGLGLRKTILAAAAMGLMLISALISTALAFVLFPVLVFLLMALPEPGGARLSSGHTGYRITAVSGPLSGKSYTISGKNASLDFGRERCKVLFPPDTPGVSRQHCSVILREGVPYLVDLGSHYGTFLLSPTQRLAPNSPVRLTENKSFCLARNDISFVINKL